MFNVHAVFVKVLENLIHAIWKATQELSLKYFFLQNTLATFWGNFAPIFFVTPYPLENFYLKPWIISGN